MKIVTVGDLGKIITGKTPPTKDKDNYGGDIPFITPVDMVGNRNIFATERYISKKGLNTVKNCFLPEHSVCVSCIGSDMGKSVLTVKPSVTNQQINSIIVDENSFDYLYIYYLMRTLEEKIKSLGKNATAVPILNKTKFSNIEVSVFDDLERQKAISSILSAYDNLIENNQKQIKLLEEAAQRLYKEWFIDLRFPGYETTPIVDGVPERWSFGELGDIAMDSGKKKKKEHRNQYQYYLPIDCLPKKSLAYTDKNDISLAKSSLVAFTPNDILFGAMRPYFHKVVVARDMGLTRTTCFVINSKTPEYWAYLLMFLFSKNTVDYATQISVGTTIPYVRWNDFTHMPILIPPVEICDAFQTIILPIIERISCLADSCERLIQARDRLLPKLMSGEMEV